MIRWTAFKGFCVIVNLFDFKRFGYHWLRVHAQVIVFPCEEASSFLWYRRDPGQLLPDAGLLGLNRFNDLVHDISNFIQSILR